MTEALSLTIRDALVRAHSLRRLQEHSDREVVRCETTITSRGNVLVLVTERNSHGAKFVRRFTIAVVENQ